MSVRLLLAEDQQQSAEQHPAASVPAAETWLPLCSLTSSTLTHTLSHRVNANRTDPSTSRYPSKPGQLYALQLLLT